MNLKKEMLILCFSLLFLLPIFRVDAESSQVLKDMSNLLPDRLGNYSINTKIKLGENIDKKDSNGFLYRVQKAYGMEGSPIMAVVAIQFGTDVPKNIANVFSKGTPTKISNYEAVILPPENSSTVYASLKISSNMMVTVVVLNTIDASYPLDILRLLDLDGLKAIADKNN